MTKRPNNPARRPMSPEAKARIAEGMRRSAEARRLAMGITPSETITKEPRPMKPLELVKMKDQNFDPILFQPMLTGSPVDKLFSTEGGIPRATNFIVIGDPGSGKSTVTLDVLSDLARGGQKVLFISAEMTRIDLFGYVQRYPKFGEVDILFLGEYLDDNPKTVLEQAFLAGYDVVLIDSFAEVMEAIKESNHMTTSSTEKFLIDLMVRHNLANNNTKTHTTFLVIQQMTKGGCFLGSNKLKHNTTGMLHLEFDKNGASFAYFSKNRRGAVNKKMYYSLKEKGHVTYDERRFLLDEDADAMQEEEKTRLEEEADAFDTLFGTGGLDATAEDYIEHK